MLMALKLESVPKISVISVLFASWWDGLNNYDCRKF